ELYQGGSEEAETKRFEELARQMREVQVRLRGRRSVADRGLHAKMLAGTTRAVLKVEAPELTGGYLRAGERHAVTVRFSSASGLRRDDHARDARGIALRVHAPSGDHDLLLTNAEVSHVRDAEEFMRFVRATSHGMLPGLVSMLARHPRRTLEIVRTLLRQTADCRRSLAHETFWSRAPFLLGNVPVRYQLVPRASGEPHALSEGPDFLFFDLKRRLRVGPLRYDLLAQSYASESATPIEDASVRWTTRPERVAVLELEQQELPMPCTDPWRAIDALAFNPWHAPEDMRPLGSLNRARKLVYRASQRERDLPADAMGCPLHTLPALIGAGLRWLARLR
ncbi:MAG: catalase, partial [Polyangiales bacterium]